MIKFSEDYVNSLAPNQSAISNGWSLVQKASFTSLSMDEAETILFGFCKGSGQKPYLASVDFLQADDPVFRCTCPSRQFPCKHCLGLMYALTSEKTFVYAEIPAEILEKRQKVIAKEEKKKAQTEAKPKQVNQAAYQKKLKVQLAGLVMLDQVVNDLVQAGLGTINQKTLDGLKERVKEFGNHYLPGVQKLLNYFIYLFEKKQSDVTLYHEAALTLTKLALVAKKGTEYLQTVLENPGQPFDSESMITEWLGQAWQFEELKQAGQVKQQVELVQLSFTIFNNVANAEYQDLGQWIDLDEGKIYETINYRPYKALKHLKEEDSFLAVVQTEEMVVYPGDINQRIRWERMTTREVNQDDLAKLRSYASHDFQELVTKVKNILKAPLGTRSPVCLLKYAQLGQVGEELVLEDLQGKRLVLKDLTDGFEHPTLQNLLLLSEEILRDQVMLGRFHYQTATRSLFVQPLSIITATHIIRLV